jgi:ATP-dependent Clp protease ATP-binding subunit ClpX
MPTFGEGRHLIKCSFCGKSMLEVKRMWAGPDVYVCDECVEWFHNDIAEMNEG